MPPVRRFRSCAALLLASCAKGALIASANQMRYGLRTPTPCMCSTSRAAASIDLQILQCQLKAVLSLPRIATNAKGPRDGRVRTRENTDVIVDEITKVPSYRRLFTHETWKRYTCQAPLKRWWRIMTDLRFSQVSAAIMPEVLLSFAYAFTLSSLLHKLLPTIVALNTDMWVPLSLQGTAIGLMLVFRTNSAYVRLDEAREQWGKLLMLMREIAIKASISLPISVACKVCRYLCAFSWSLRDKLRDGDNRDDVLALLLSKKEAAWVKTQRSRPLAIQNLLRRLFFAEYDAGQLDANVHNSLDRNLEHIDGVVESCERLFGSPIPPNMARHGLRSLTIWIMAMPFVMLKSMSPLVSALWTAATAYIFFGVEELGCQVEQPFQIMPLWQLCHVAQLNVEEALSTPDSPLVLADSCPATLTPAH